MATSLKRGPGICNVPQSKIELDSRRAPAVRSDGLGPRGAASGKRR